MEFMGVNYDNASAVDIFRNILSPYGLGDLAQGMYDIGKTTGGDTNAAYLWLRQQPQYKQAFPGMAMREQNKYSPINEETYMQYVTTMKSVMQQNGIPADFYDSPNDFADFIGKNISPQEVESRVSQGVVAARNAPPEVKQALFNFYGIDDGHLAAYYLDPNRSADLLQRQAATAQIGGAAMKQGFGSLARDEAERLQKSTGVDQATERLGTLGQAQELLGTLPGEQESSISREQQLQYVEGAQPAATALAKKAAQRKAQFAGGGGYAETAQGVSGLGASSK